MIDLTKNYNRESEYINIFNLWAYYVNFEIKFSLNNYETGHVK